MKTLPGSRALKPLVALLMLASVSCHKKSNDNPFGNLKIATVDFSHNGAGLHYQLFYGNGNNIDSIGITTSTGLVSYEKLTYFGSSWSVSGPNTVSRVISANTAGTILKMSTPGDTVNYIYTNNLLAEIDMYVPSAAPPYYKKYVSSLTWKNGDLLSNKSPSSAQNYSYLTSKNGQPGDALRIDDILSIGAPLIRTTHLPVAETYGNGIGELYFYNFDTKGRISTFTRVWYDSVANSKDTAIYAYSYY